MDWLFQTDNTFSYVVLRAGLAYTFFMHGTQHIFGWWDGRGARGMVKNWNEKYGNPVFFCWLALFIEAAGVLSMISGFLVRPAAFGLASFMFMAIKESHWEWGFFLNQGPGKGSGLEYCLALMLMALALAIGGAGALSIDQLISR
jgi:putative oxidoreductase